MLSRVDGTDSMSGSFLGLKWCDMVERSLTETRECCQSGEDNDPVLSLPDHPAAVDEDEVPKEVAHREENVPAKKRRSLVGEALDASGALPQSVRKPSARREEKPRGRTYQDRVEVVELYRKVGRATQEECAHESDDGAMRRVVLLRLCTSDEQEDRGDKEHDIDACCEVSRVSYEGRNAYPSRRPHRQNRAARRCHC